MTASKIFFYFCLFFISGIFFVSIIDIPILLNIFLLVLSITLISVFWHNLKNDEDNKKIVLAGFFLLFLFFGIWRHQFTENQIENSSLKAFNNIGRAVTLVGLIIREPDVRQNNIKLIIEPEEIAGQKVKNQGFVLATVSHYKKYKYGDKVEIFGELKAPPSFSDFNYKNYLETKKIYSVIYYPRVKLLRKEDSKNIFNFLLIKIFDLKNKVRNIIYRDLPSPQKFILGAMILGDKNRMPESLKNKLNIAGVRHITAVSGMHIIILSSILMSLLLFLGLWRGQAFYISIIFIFLFIITTGAQPSGIRAGIMGGFFLLGEKIGRKSVSFRAILIAAAIMLAFNPLLLLNDAGFQLSFLAALGIIYLAPIFRYWLKNLFSHALSGEKKKNNKKMAKIIIVMIDILAVTLSAQVFTLPLLIYNFGRISLVAPLTNILILPVIYWIMAFGFVFSLIGLIFPFWGWIFSFPCLFLLTYLTKVINFFSQSWAVKNFNKVSLFWLILAYLILGVLAWKLNKDKKLKFLDY